MLNAQTNIPESSDTATPTDGPEMGGGLRPETVRPGMERPLPLVRRDNLQTMNTTDWTGLMPDVAQRLLGDPTSKTSREWRYGHKGALSR